MSVNILPSTPQTVVFPLNEEYGYFETKFYDPQLMENQVSLEEIKKFISEINGEYLKYKIVSTEQKKKCNYFGYFAVIIGIFDCMLFFSSAPDFLGIFTKGETIILTLFFLFCLNNLCGCIFGCKIMGIDYLNQMKDKCQDMLDKENETLRNLHLKWHLPEAFPAWIELTKDMRKQNNDLEIPAQNVIPQTTPTRIIFPRLRYKNEDKNGETLRFSYDFFSTEMVNHQISYKEVQEFLCEMNVHLRTPFKMTSRMAWVTHICLCIELFGILYVRNHIPDRLTTLQQFFIVVSSTFITFHLSGDELNKEEEKKASHIKLGAKRIVDKYNKNLRNRGLRWHLPNEFPQWIELCNSQSQGPDGQSINIRPIENQGPSITPGDDIEMGNQNGDQNSNKAFENNLSAPLLKD